MRGRLSTEEALVPQRLGIVQTVPCCMALCQRPPEENIRTGELPALSCAYLSPAP